MDIIEMTGKSVEEAVEKALKLLNAKRDDVLIEIVDEGARGFLGLGQKPARVSVSLKEDPVRTAKRFLREISTAMGMDVAANAVFDESSRTMSIDLKGINMGVFIGKHGQTLDALQYLTNLVVNKNTENYISIQLDTENYRLKRKEALEALARNTAKKVKQTKRPARLEPMSPAERRVIHATLQNERQITTFSEGVEPFRNVVVAMKREGAPDGARNQQNRSKGTDHGRGQTGYAGKPQSQNRFVKYPKDQTKQDNYNKFISSAPNDTEDEDR